MVLTVVENMRFVPLGIGHANGVMKIFSYYCVNSYAAFPSTELGVAWYQKFLELSRGYPAYAVTDAADEVLGFCFLSAYNPFPTFRKTAKFSCFIAPDFRGQGIGSACLQKICSAARDQSVSVLISEIADCNQESISFHERHGFVRVGELADIGEKFGGSFGVVLMRKTLSEKGRGPVREVS